MFNNNDDNNNDFGMSPDDYSDGGNSEHQQILYEFMDAVTRGITTKIPTEVIPYIPKPSIKEIESASVFLARNTEKMANGSLGQREESSFLRACSIMLRGNIHDAVDKGVRVLTEDHYNEYCKKTANETYVALMQSDGLVDFVFNDDPENPDIELLLTEEGRKEFPVLYLAEKKKSSYFTDTLETLVGGRTEATRLLQEHSEKMLKEHFTDSTGMAELLRDIFKSDEKDDGEY